VGDPRLGEGVSGVLATGVDPGSPSSCSPPVSDRKFHMPARTGHVTCMGFPTLLTSPVQLEPKPSCTPHVQIMEWSR